MSALAIRSARRPLRVIVAFAIFFAAGCQAMGPSGGMGSQDEVPYPAGCGAHGLSPLRCSMIVDQLARAAGITTAEAVAIGLLGDPGCGEAQDTLCTRTTPFIVRARFHLPDGRALEQSQFCGVGGQYSILCTEHPDVYVSVPTDGYGDVPCVGDDLSSCATRFPGPDPVAANAERPVSVETLVIPLDHVGNYSVEVGEGTLANGILETSTMTLDEGGPATYLLSEGGIRLVLKSAESDGRPFDNYYAHGRRDGLERFTARVEFKVQRYDAGAAITLRDILVR
jgi:hypothetical protein